MEDGQRFDTLNSSDIYPLAPEFVDRGLAAERRVSDEILIAMGVGLGLVALVAIFSFNRIAALASRCDRAAADIDVQLRHRHDLIPNLVETVKGFASHERGLVDSLMSARAAAVRAASTADRDRAETEMSARIGMVFTTVEQYPEVKGSQHFTELRREMTDVENKIAATRRFFNMAVSEYNATLGQFPANAIARFAGLRPRAMFDLVANRATIEEAPAAAF